MLLTMRPTGGHSPIYADRQDWTVLDEGQPVGRIYEDTSASTPDQRWTWSITVYVGRMPVSPQAGRRQRSTKRRPNSAQLDRVVEAGSLGAPLSTMTWWRWLRSTG